MMAFLEFCAKWGIIGLAVLFVLYIIARVISRAATKSYLETIEEHKQEHAKRIVKQFQEKLSKDYPTEENDE